MTGSQVDPHPAISDPKLRGDIEAWIRGIESGIWNPTAAMKRHVALVLREFLNEPRSAVVRPTRDQIARCIANYWDPEGHSLPDDSPAYEIADALIREGFVAVSDSQETPT